MSVTFFSPPSTNTSSTVSKKTKSANYTILISDGIIFSDTSGAAFTLTLPNPALVTSPFFYIIDTKGTFSTNNLTLAPFGSEKIEGLAASKVLQTAWGFFIVTTDGTDWYVG